MKLQDVLERVESSKTFEYWKKDNEGSYLSSFFKIVEAEDKNWWQLDFYNPKKDKMTSFVAEKEIKLVGKDSKIFKREHDKVEKLILEKVHVDAGKAVQICLDLLKDKYDNAKVTKKIVILQNVQSIIWNISLLTPTLKLLNVRIDADSGAVLEDSYKNMLEFRSQSE